MTGLSNIGVWVGPQWKAALTKAGIKSMAFQGVDASAYPATLDSYLTEGGSNAGAKSLATTVQNYVSGCPDSAIIVSGWRSVLFSIVVESAY